MIDQSDDREYVRKDRGYVHEHRKEVGQLSLQPIGCESIEVSVAGLRSKSAATYLRRMVWTNSNQ